MTEDLEVRPLTPADELDEMSEGRNGPNAIRNRRGLLLGVAAGLGGLAAGVLAGSQPAGASGNGTPVLLGDDNGGATNRTAVFHTNGTINDFVATLGDPGNQAGVVGQDNSSGAGISQGVYGTSKFATGVFGVSSEVSAAGASAEAPEAGVWGDSTTNPGVVGASDAYFGVGGYTSANGASGVTGQDVSAGGGYGVSGRSGSGIGVYGETLLDTSGIGVSGKDGSSGGKAIGVKGESPKGTGVLGVATSASGIAVSAQNASGTALEVKGAATFTRSGVLSISAGSAAATHTGITLQASSLVLANLQNNLPGVYVEAIVPNVAGDSFKVVLSKAVPSGKTAHVGWFVVN
jgi:hypothetical protein